MEQLRKSEICTFLVPLKDIHFLHFIHSYLDKLLDEAGKQDASTIHFFFFLKKKKKLPAYMLHFSIFSLLVT